MSHPILVSHEMPLALKWRSERVGNQVIPFNEAFCDYDFALVHLIQKDPQYKQWVLDNIAKGREVILDNSIYELGTSFDPDQYRQIINEIKPTWYILPDVFNDMRATLNNADRWMFGDNTGKDLHTKLINKSYPIGVVQGKTYNDFAYLYKWYVDAGVSYIAFNFSSVLYDSFGVGNCEEEIKCDGRYRVIKQLEQDGILNKYIPHHLLGCTLPQEFKRYADMPYIRSLDTSNPVLHGLIGERYRFDHGLDYKSDQKMLAEDAGANMEISSTQLEDVIFNIKQFKYILQR